MQLNLRDYQEAAVTSALSFLSKGVAPLIIAPTGAGKTVIASALMLRWQAGSDRKCFFVAHRKELVEQAQKTMDKVGVKGEALSVFSSDFAHISQHDKETALVVFDEAHHAVASSWTKFNSIFTGPKVAVTATPDRLDRQKLESAGFESCYEIEIRTLIDQGHLVKPMAQKMPIEMSLTLMRSYDDKLEAVADAVIREMARWDRKKAIAFMPDVECSERFVDLLRARGIKCAHVDGATHDYTRSMAVTGFKSGDLQILCNVNLFTEGFDAPETDCVILLRPTQSRALWCQMVGRGLRLAPGKTDCLILDPMWISGEHSFQPADAFTVHPMAKSRCIDDSHDPLAAAEFSDRDAEKVMLDRIEKEEKKASAKEARALGLIDLSTACAVFGFVLPPSKGDAMFHYQTSELARYGVHGVGMTIDQADWVIGRLKARESLGLATVKQVRKLKQFGIAGAYRLTKEAASKAISSDWRMTAGRATPPPLPRLLSYDDYNN